MRSLRNRHFFLIDLVMLPAVAILAFAMRLNADDLQLHVPHALLFALLALPIKLITYTRFGLYRRYWRYASIDELVLITLASIVGSAVTAALLFALVLPLTDLAGFPRSIPLIDGMLTMMAVGGIRFLVRLAERRRDRELQKEGGQGKRVLVMGAGDSGARIVREMLDDPRLQLVPVAFLDDDERKIGVRIHGIHVVGNRTKIPELVRQHRLDEVIIAMPTAAGAAIRDIFNICSRAGVRARTIPALHDIISGRISLSQLREVEIEDLLRREPVRVDSSAVEQMLRGCRVLVTGAGGSIGSEMCRQIARSDPECLILLGHGEHSIYTIANDLRQLWPQLSLYPVIADVRDLNRLRHVFHDHRPVVVFHAAAHKHVPLMEHNAAEAVTNNVLGTSNLLAASEANRVERFVLVSTDKAVDPSSVMGATKRVAELLVQAVGRRSESPYVAVRFGNVLGSRGSVVPLFREQIARGGPVTVTDPDVRRFFMTIPEAVQLVLQAAALARLGGVFFLDMGEPVRIVDLARDLITLSGLEVGRDVDIEYVGMRPGEKMVEELFVEGEEYIPTQHDKIFCLHDDPDGRNDAAGVEQAVDELIILAWNGSDAEVRAKLQEIVPEYNPPGSEG